jgi:hypothetical protein
VFILTIPGFRVSDGDLRLAAGQIQPLKETRNMAGSKFRTCVRALVVLLAMIGLAGLTPQASASEVTFTIPAGTQVGGLPVSATATFTTLDGRLEISLTNTLVNPTAIIQNLSDLGFTLSSGQTTGTLAASSGLERTVNDDGTFTDGGVVDTGWALEASGAGQRVHVLGTAIGPAHTIIGEPDAGDLYSNANNSIAGNGPHNPFLAGEVTFSIDIAGLTTADTVTQAIFSFGTEEGNNVVVPEPTSMLLMGGMFAGLGAFGYRRRFIRQQVAS